MKEFICRITPILLLSVFSSAVFAVEPDDQESALQIPHAQNAGGLTGLIFTNSAYTLAKGKFEIGTGVLMERSRYPAFATLQMPVNVTYGVSETIELGFGGKSIYMDTVGEGFGDVELKAKWRVFETAKTKSGGYLPAVAVGASVMLPTATTAELEEVSSWGGKVMLMVTSEGTDPANRYVGTYLDAQYIMRDPGSTSVYSDNYWVVNLGLLLPYQDDNNFQIIGEVSFVGGNTNFSLDPSYNDITKDYVGYTLGLRYASDTIRLTTGVQLVDKKTDGFKDTYRVLATASVEL